MFKQLVPDRALIGKSTKEMSKYVRLIGAAATIGLLVSLPAMAKSMRRESLR